MMQARSVEVGIEQTKMFQEPITMECKGMVQCLSQTYRIMKVNPRSYEVFRILDDVRVGRFDVDPRLRVHPTGITSDLLMQIATMALKQAKVSWRDTIAAIDSNGR
jgi:hypothetical protein